MTGCSSVINNLNELFFIADNYSPLNIVYIIIVNKQQHENYNYIQLSTPIAIRICKAIH